MSRFRCPVACPIAWRKSQDSACTCAGFGSHLPANDFPPVSRSFVFSSDRLPASVLGGSLGVICLRGEVGICPVVAPFGRLSLNALTVPTTSHLPAKEKTNRVQQALATGGEL